MSRMMKKICELLVEGQVLPRPESNFSMPVGGWTCQRAIMSRHWEKEGISTLVLSVFSVKWKTQQQGRAVRCMGKVGNTDVPSEATGVCSQGCC